MANDAWKVITPVVTEPVTRTDLKLYTRIDFSDDDTLVDAFISRARRRAETITGRAFATQTIQQEYTIARPEGGELSGPISHGPNWYQYQEQLGANPFGAAQFYFDLAMPPIQSTISTIQVNTKVTAFAPWTAFPLVTNPDGSQNMWIANTQEPARLFFMDPITANFWQFIFVCGYSSSYLMPEDLLQPLCELVAYYYDNRADENPDQRKEIEKALLSKRIADAWI